MAKTLLTDEEKAERNRANVKRWRKENPEKRREQARRDAANAYAKDPDKFRERSRQYRLSLPEDERRQLSQQAWEWQKRHRSWYILKNAQYRAKRDGLPFYIKIEDVVIPEICPVLGIRLEFSPGPGGRGFGDSSPSLDKIVPSLGYVPGNIRVISYRANSLKKDATADELRAVLDYVERETERVRRELG